MQWRERPQFAEPFHDVVVDKNRRCEISATVHDPVANRLEPVRALLRKPGEELAQKVLVRELCAARVKSGVDDRAATGLPRRQMRSDPDLLNLAAENFPQLGSARGMP